MSCERKSIMLLEIYDTLKSGQHLNRVEFMKEHNLSSPTFYRYISDIRLYIMKEHPEMKLAIDNKREYFLLQEN